MLIVPTQTWKWRRDKTLKLDDGQNGNLCLTLTSDQQRLAVLAPCSPELKWTLTADFHLIHEASRLCLDTSAHAERLRASTCQSAFASVGQVWKWA